MQQWLSQEEELEIESPPKESQISSLLKNKLMNLTYALKNNSFLEMPFSSRSSVELKPGYSKASLLGEQFSYQNAANFYAKFQETIWFSYRNINNHLEDRGWGCMIRAIQMLIANSLKRSQPHLSLMNVIDYFREETNGDFSLTHICKQGHINRRWTSCPEILQIVSSIHEVVKKQKKISFNFEIFFQELSIKQYEEYKQSDFPRLITIYTKVGTENIINENFECHLIQLIKDKRFAGMISGTSGEALFIIGEYEKKAIILDPHYVQTNEKQESFFEKSPQAIEFSRLYSGMALSYYVESLEDFGYWVTDLILMNRMSKPYLVFDLKVDNQKKWYQEKRKKSDDFLML